VAIFRGYIADVDAVVVWMAALHVPFLAIGFSKYKPVANALFVGYFLRFITMLIDLYTRFPLPHSGGDTERFLATATVISDNLYLLGQEVYGGAYSKLLGMLFSLTGPHRVIGQYLNVILGVTNMILAYKILRSAGVPIRIARKCVWILALFPHSIIFSSILLRENLVILFLLLSFYNFTLWFGTKNGIRVLLSISFLLVACAFHSGLIGFLPGYAFMYMFYSHKQKTFLFSPRSLLVFGVFALLSLAVFTRYAHVFLFQIQKADSIDHVYRMVGSGSGGSAYLTNISVNSFGQLLAYAPLKILFFLGSPMPINWRGLSDVVSFLVDSVFYLYFLWFILSNVKHIRKSPYLIGTALMLSVTVAIFGIPLSNAGTAMRHRHKLFPIFVIVYALLLKAQVVEAALEDKENVPRISELGKQISGDTQSDACV
jgi:4-amino-4-deoxy-L-arabinose transferase-like glycosyltransferase